MTIYKKENFLIYLLIIILIALLSGVVASLAIKIFLPSDQAVPPEVVVKKIRVGEGPAEILLRETAGKLVYLIAKSEQSFLTKEEVKARGVILTSDGWIITAKSSLIGQFKNYQAATDDGRVFEIIKRVDDPASGVTFLQLGNDQKGNSPNSLPVISLAREATLAQDYYVVSSREELAISSLVNLDYLVGEQTESADFLSRYYLLQQSGWVFQPGLTGSAVVDGRGELVGLLETVDGESLVIPAAYFADLLGEVLREQKITRSFLGINYFDLSKVYSGERGRGAILKASAAKPAIQKEAPGWRGGLYAGDIITKVEGEELNGYNNLSQIIQEYEPGTELKFTVLRNGEEKELTVKLGEQ